VALFAVYILDKAEPTHAPTLVLRPDCRERLRAG
jgi:hypothetical protein